MAKNNVSKEGLESQAKALRENRPSAPNQRHGVFPFIKSGLHPCNKCVKAKDCDRFQEGADCSYLGEFQENLEESVMDLEFVSEQDRPVVQLLTKEMAIIALCEMYFAVEGMVIHDKRKKKLDAQPLMNTYNKFLYSSKQTMSALGLGPAARTKINLEKVNVVKQMGELGVGGTDEQEGLDFLDD
ncbi:P27 family phage terminase small subunit [Brevibacillus laterosporus]|uniref:P27 family phage terminase small subunit n=1 Tax=Brevibacillus laterosporus TaxID=1465 RepID=UPI003D1E4EF6